MRRSWRRRTLLRRRWELTVDAGDRNVQARRPARHQDRPAGDHGAVGCLGDRREVAFKDIDNDTDPVTYVVAIVGIEEKAAKPRDGARWGECQVTLVLEETRAGRDRDAAGWVRAR